MGRQSDNCCREMHLGHKTQTRELVTRSHHSGERLHWKLMASDRNPRMLDRTCGFSPGSPFQAGVGHAKHVPRLRMTAFRSASFQHCTAASRMISSTHYHNQIYSLQRWLNRSKKCNGSSTLVTSLAYHFSDLPRRHTTVGLSPMLNLKYESDSMLSTLCRATSTRKVQEMLRPRSIYSS